MPLYRAKKTCLLGFLRKAGQEFNWQKLDPMPEYLEEVKVPGLAAAEAAPPKPAVKKGRKAAVGPSSEELGGTNPKSVAEVNSGDMIPR